MINKEKIITITKKTGYILKDVTLHFPRYSVKAAHTLVIFMSFFLILQFFMFSLVVEVLKHIPLVSKGVNRAIVFWNRSLKRYYDIFYEKLESLRPFKIRRKYLVYVAFQNLNIRKSRSIITIMGMSIGVAIIVYLLSLGYGIEKLVISQVASLEELQMVDVSAGESSTGSITKQAVQKMSKLAHVKEVIPLISVVGRLNYKNAKTDTVVYAVPKNYFKASAKQFIKGSYFSQLPDYTISSTREIAEVAGISDVISRKTYDKPVTSYKLSFAPLPQVQVPVFKECSIKSELLGFTIRTEGDYQGMEFYGREYAPFETFGRVAYDEERNIFLGQWIKAELPIYEEDKNISWKFGCVPRKYVQITQELPIIAEVLGEATESATTASSSATVDEENESTPSAEFADAKVASAEGGMEIIYLNPQKNVAKEEKILEYKQKVSGNAVISSGLLKLLSISPDKIKEESFKISYIIIKSLMPTVPGRILTSEQEYKITGVIDDDENQYIYVPIQDITVLGVSNYSQVKLQLDDQKNMSEIRKQVETLGYKTASTADTIAEIETFFGSLRTVLAFIGFIALGVASLGMFNTLTVSLLERTREIGGMKTMGMVSGEIQELFLAEAMIMGFAGGIGGLLFGFIVGKLSSYIVSIIAISQGVGYLELTYIPWSLTTFIVVSSFVVGVITGLYPAYRAKHISALNALRYE